MSNSKRSRRQFTTEQKVTILRRHLVDKEPVSKICEDETLQPSLLYQWMRQAFENLGASLGPAVSGERSKREKELVSKTKDLEARLAKKDNVIAEISAEYVQLKKELGES
jgi:transposase